MQKYHISFNQGENTFSLATHYSSSQSRFVHHHIDISPKARQIIWVFYFTERDYTHTPKLQHSNCIDCSAIRSSSCVRPLTSQYINRVLIYWTHTLIACRRCRRRVVVGTRALFGTCVADGWRGIPPTQVSADENYHTRVLGKRRNR